MKILPKIIKDASVTQDLWLSQLASVGGLAGGPDHGRVLQDLGRGELCRTVMVAVPLITMVSGLMLSPGERSRTENNEISSKNHEIVDPSACRCRSGRRRKARTGRSWRR